MSNLPKMPEVLITLRDSALEAIKSNNQLPNLQPLYDWFKTDGWDLITDAWYQDALAIPLTQLFNKQLNDLALSGYLGVQASEITDQDRIESARRLIQDSTDEFLSVHICKLLNHHASPVLCCLASLNGYEYEVDWWGIYKNDRLFLDELKTSGYLLSIESDTISDEQILSLWNEAA